MTKTQETLRKNGITKVAVLHVALELSDSKWKLAFSDGSKVRMVAIDYGNIGQFREAIWAFWSGTGRKLLRGRPIRLLVASVFNQSWDKESSG